MTITVLVFAVTYIGMGLGGLPGLALDRTGVALLGLIVLIGSGTVTLAEASTAVDVPTIALLFALMIISAQFEQSGFYNWLAVRITKAAVQPRLLLAVVILATGLLSAILTNDVVVFALTPLLCSGLIALNLDVRPYLMALAAAANAGSAATLIGNPQNILIGQAGKLDFWRYIAIALPPTLVVMAVIYGVIVLTWQLQPAMTKPQPGNVILSRFQLGKGIVAAVTLVGLFLTPAPREVAALGIAGVLLLSRRLSSRDMIGAVDWHLLLMFTCLFGITDAFAKTGLAQAGVAWLAQAGLNPDHARLMVPISLLASNTIGNVPFVVLLLKVLPQLGTGALFCLAMLSTFAGNLLLTGSLCNIIVAERAAPLGAQLSFADFARAGIPITLISMAVTALWLLATRLLVF